MSIELRSGFALFFTLLIEIALTANDAMETEVPTTGRAHELSESDRITNQNLNRDSKQQYRDFCLTERGQTQMAKFMLVLAALAAMAAYFGPRRAILLFLRL